MKIYKAIMIACLMLTASFVYSQSTVSIWVGGTCGMCQERIETASMQIGGVEKASWDIATNLLTLEVDNTFYADDLHTHLNSLGHDTQVSKASDKAYEALHGCCKYRDVVEETPDKYLYGEGTVYLWVDGICGMCKDRIEEAALKLKGVKKASYNIEARMISMKVNKNFDEATFHLAMNEVGHDTKISLASDEQYDTVHGCCKYRDQEIVNQHNTPDGTIASSTEDESEIKVTFPADKENKAFGMIYEQLKSGKKQPVIGATVQWAGSSSGTSTDVDGFFEIPKDDAYSKLVVSYVGYVNDTIDMTNQNSVQLLLKTNYILDDVTIKYRKKTTEVSFLNTFKVQNIGEKELCKAACCNLSESFETNPSVDVSFTDAVTGTRKIEMLGLAGPYVQVMRENMPYIRGLAALYGFSYTPGTWIESMQLNMGAASVVNGPEAMTGQINVEIKKPEESERLYVNAFFNEAQRAELNINGTEKITDRWSTAYLLHGNKQSLQRDRNNDGFIDLPLNEQFIAMNRWKYTGKNGLQSQFGIKGTYIDKVSGQLFNTNEPTPENLWQANVRTERLEGWMKIGGVSSTNPNKSLGFQLNATHHNQKANFHENRYDAQHQSAYANLIYQTVLKNPDHKLRTGASFQFDKYSENVINQDFFRTEYLPGAFAEYHYAGNDKFSLITGLRADYHNNFGLFFTPRIHAKYSPNGTTAWRFVLGRGQRTASIFAENVGIFASNRQVIIENEDNGNPYGLDQEIAWNTGVNFTKEIIINQKSLVLAFDYYYTMFTNQILFDYDINPQEVHIYNLDGQSYSHSVQAQADMEVFDGVDVRVAYRFNDVKVDQKNGLVQKALTSQQRAFINVGWEITKSWIWDATVNFQGSKRIPSTASNPEQYRLAERSPSFVTVNTQISKAFNKNFEAYLGTENLFNYIQDNAIVAFDDIDSPFFDSSLVWGPINGRNIYVGLRYKMF